MSIDLTSISKNTQKPQRIVLYGLQGIGKTSFAAGAEKPIFIITEDGLGELDVPHFPLATSFEEVLEALGSLGSGEHDYKTVIIDSLDWLEPLTHDATCRRLNVKSIEEPGYGKGYVENMREWDLFFDYVTALRNVKGMTVIMIAHNAIVRVEDPVHPAFDMHDLKLHKKACARVKEFADVILFATMSTIVTTEKGGFNKTRTRAIDDTNNGRVLCASPSAAFVAKHRTSMPDKIPLVWTEFEKYLPSTKTNGGN
jgi:hypothetical protein